MSVLYRADMGGQVAGYGWVRFEVEDIRELSLRVNLLEGEAYIWDCATLPGYRGKHI